MSFNHKVIDLEEKSYDYYSFWRNMELSMMDKLTVNYDFVNVNQYEKNTISFNIDNKVSEKLDLITKRNELLTYIVFLTAINIQLYKYTNKDKNILGIPAYISLVNENTVIQSSILPLKIDLNDETKIKSLMLDLKSKVLNVYENQYCDINTMLRNIGVCNDVMDMTSVNLAIDVLHHKKYVDNIIKSDKNQITIYFEKKQQNILFSIIYNAKLYKKETMDKFGQHYLRIIEGILNNLDKTVKDIEILSEEEKNQILYEFNDTKTEYPRDKTIQQLFEDQVEKTPNNIAVVFEEKKLTYRELNEKANSFARVLRNKGVKADSIVGIMVERSLEMIVGIMGILKAGGAYLPIDPNYPKERVEYMLKDSQSKILLSKSNLVKNIEFNGNIIELFNNNLFNGGFSNLNKINRSSNLAYVIYTSGTTGKPKGTMIQHFNISNFINSFNGKFNNGFNSQDKILSLTNYVFDVSVCEFFTSLISGATLVINNKHKTFDPMEISKLITEHNITFTYVPPSLLTHIYNVLKNDKNKIKLNKLLVGVESIQGKTLKKFYELNTNIEIINGYGPTESTICSTFYKVSGNEESNKNIQIGSPIANTKIYILDTKNNLLPIGCSGELCITGEGLSRGYLNRPELTDEKFIDNPFEAGTKMYKTGDLARWLPDGNMEFLGRIDNQVKIRGFRIELGEIENSLLQHESIKEVAVEVKENKEKEKYICAYVVSEKSFDKLNIKSYLKEILPEYMIPAYFMNLEKMPLTANGKLDRRALPEPNLNDTLNEYEAARNNVEEVLVRIWSEVLGVRKIGINNNFFELGGHSLKATVLISKIHKELGKEVPLKELFKSPTIKELSGFIRGLEENPYSKIEKVEEKEYYKASSAQNRMYMLQQFDKESIAYNMPIAFELEGNVNKEKIEETFKGLVERHDALKTYFENLNGEIMQKLQSNYEFRLVEKKENRNIDDLINEFIRPFNLEKVPLFRVELVGNKEKTYLLIDMHHIISDGVSVSVLIKEFVNLYNGKNLEPLKLQYKDFAAWQNDFLKSEEIKKQEEYWISVFSDEIPVLNMSTDYERPVMQSFEGDSVNFEIDEKTTQNLRKITKETGTTMHMILLSAFNILLSKYSGQEDIVVGTPIAGRVHGDLQNIMGMFVNTLALRNKPEGNKKYIDFLKEIKENSLNAYENQSYQFEALVEKLDITRDTSRNPLFDVMFNMVDTVNENDIKLNNILLKQYNNGNKISKFDLMLNALEEENKLKFSIDYCSKLFNKETIERLSNHFIIVLGNITNNIEIRLREIEVLTEKERNQILYKFNDTKVDYPKDKTIQELFEEQVEKTPDNIAVVFEDKKLTYRELNEKSNQLARVLRNKGVKAESIVAIMVERSLEMIIGIMGILKSGGAYLPIDPKYPVDRIDYMLKDSQVELAIVDNNSKNKINIEEKAININDIRIFEGSKENLDILNKSEDTAYVIYTSGSTGMPKGVMIEHRSLVNRLNWMQKKYPISEKDTILQKTTYTFDVSVWELLWWSLVGAKVCMLSPNNQKDPKKIIEAINKHGVTTMHFVPSMLDVFLYCVEENRNNINLSSLRQVFSSGEALNFKQVSKFYKEFESGKKLINLYGPTEATIDVSYFDCINDGKRIIPIGKPIDNTELYILKNNELVPIGVAGELYIAGHGLARGYVNRAELTAEKFIENPFKAGTRMYKTGDLARWLPDGNIEFLGRIDNQVKIRGFRIELGEIESRLLQHENIKEAAVLVKENKDGEKYICSYVVSEKNPQELDLKGYLKERLPEYMVPAYFVELEKMPLTANGKLDRKALPEPSLDATLTEYEAPRNEVEETLAKIWSEILGVEKVGINDNFFDHGGHSLKATMLMSKIHKELNKEVSLKELFKSPTIKSIEKVLTNERNLDAILPKIQLELNDRFCWCKLKNFIVDNKKYIVLFCDRDKREIIEYIGYRYSDEYSPHFVTSLKNLPSSKDDYLNRDELLNAIGIGREHNNTTLEKINEVNHLNQSKIREYIFRNKAVDKYKVFYMQDRFIAKKSATINIQEIIVENENNFNVILDVIKYLINENSLFRTCLVSEENKYYFMEFDKLNKLDLNLIDVSAYSMSSVKEVEDSVIANNTISLQHSNYNEKDVLYRIAIFKETQKDYRIVFSFSHIIFDGGSRSILLKSFYRNYHKIKETGSLSREVKKVNEVFRYKNYIEDTTKLNNVENIRKCLLCNDYMSFEKEMRELDEKLVNFSDGSSFEVIFSKPTVLEYKIGNPNDYSLKQDELYEGIALYLANVVLRTIFKVDKCLINITTNVRKFNNKNYDNVIGDFHSKLPVVFESNNKSVEYYYKKYRMEYKKWYINNQINLHYIGYGDHCHTKDSKKIYELFERLKFHFNFMGEQPDKLENGVKHDYQIDNMGIGKDVIFKMYRIYAYVSDNKIKLLLPSGVPKELLDELKKIRV